MKKLALVLAGVCGIALTQGSLAQSGSSPEGDRALEAAFDAGISSQDQLDWLRTMSSAPNHVGSPHDKANAEFMLARFKEFGWDAHIETFQVLYPTPISTTVEMVTPEKITLGGQEPAVPGDESTTNQTTTLPPYVAFQGDGDVTADLVYVNFGMPEDYAALARRGIDVKGLFVFVCFGVGWRGLLSLL